MEYLPESTNTIMMTVNCWDIVMTPIYFSGTYLYDNKHRMLYSQPNNLITIHNLILKLGLNSKIPVGTDDLSPKLLIKKELLSIIFQV